jgi:hypothetical protein
MEHILGEERVFGGRSALRYFSGTLFLFLPDILKGGKTLFSFLASPKNN